MNYKFTRGEMVRLKETGEQVKIVEQMQPEPVRPDEPMYAVRYKDNRHTFVYFESMFDENSRELHFSLDELLG